MAKVQSRRWKKMGWVLAGILLFVFVTAAATWWYCIRMPGRSRPLSHEAVSNSGDGAVETSVADHLHQVVDRLAISIGERNVRRRAELDQAADYIEDTFGELGYQHLSRQTFDVHGVACHNIVAEIPGTGSANEIVLLGAHYDSVVGSPGANDNGSGVAALLAIARHFKNYNPQRTLRLVAFANEEPPHFQTQEMGSWVYAQQARKLNESIVAVIALETMGYFSDQAGSQSYPPPLNMAYPSTGNFIGFVSNLESRPLLHRVIATFREHSQIPSEGACLPSFVPGVGWSDHWSFWQEGYAGIMITDTAPFRYPHYHLPSDLPEQLDYERFGLVVQALFPVVEDLLNGPAVE